MINLLHLSIREVLTLYKKKQLSCTELMQDCIDHLQKSKKLNCFINTYEESGLDQARECEKKWLNGTNRNLEGVPIGIKNCFCIAGCRISCGSKMLENFISPYTATTVHKLINNAGAINLGDTNLDEFTLGSSNENSYFGPVINPWRDKQGRFLVPGGSSGGSAAAVAAGLVFGATGTDSGGSIRQPAAWSGVVGIKPTYGLCSRFGVFAFSSSVDHPGLIARNVYDCALLLENMAGYDPQDSTSLATTIPSYTKSLTGDIKDLVIAVPREVVDNLTPSLRADITYMIDVLTKMGAQIREVNLELLEYALSVYHIIAPVEAAANFARYDGLRYGHCGSNNQTLHDLYSSSRREGLGKEVKRRILTGTYLTGYHKDNLYHKAQALRIKLAEKWAELFQQVDVIMIPTVGSEAFSLEDNDPDPVKMYFNDYFTVIANLIGVPAVTLPIGINVNSGLPRSIQFIGNHVQESLILNVAYAVEQELGIIKMTDWWWRNE